METTYIGASSITTDEIIDGIHHITLSDGSLEYLTHDQFVAVISPEPYKDGEITLRKWKPTVSGIMQLLLDANMQMNDKDWLMSRIDQTLVENFKTAVAKKFGVRQYDNISLKAIDEVLKS